MKNETALAFSDILLKPCDFSYVRSRADVDTSQIICGQEYKLPVIASNMDSVYSPELAREVAKHGGISCVHRFCTIEENVKLFNKGIFEQPTGIGFRDIKPWVSVGVTKGELERAEVLVTAGAEVLLIDVAHGAAIHVAEQFIKLKELFKDNVKIIVGNFATASQIKSFIYHSKYAPDAFKINIGSGSACSTRVITGVGLPSVASIQECSGLGIDVIQDGGITNSGDLCKCLALGAKAAFVGKLFAACKESGARDTNSDISVSDTIFYKNCKGYDFSGNNLEKYARNYCPYGYFYKIIEDKHTYRIHFFNQKWYRGSASASSYKSQGKEKSHITPEGEEFFIPVSGTVKDLMQKFEGGLRSSMSYLGAFNLEQYRGNAEWVIVSENGARESLPHGKER